MSLLLLWLRVCAFLDALGLATAVRGTERIVHRELGPGLPGYTLVSATFGGAERTTAWRIVTSTEERTLSLHEVLA